MTPEVSVERQFRFQCSCGAAMVSGEKTVTCTGCGANLGIRRARRHRQRHDSVAYYGSRTLPVRRVEKLRQQPTPVPPVGAQVRDEPHGLLVVKETPRIPLLVGVHCKVGPTRPDGRPHPHAGKTGRITRFTDLYSDPYWRGLPSAMIKLDSGIEPQGFIWVSLQCLEALPEDTRSTVL
jgi:hypothetical protein